MAFVAAKLLMGDCCCSQRKTTLSNIKTWYKQARVLNKTATPFLIGTKFDYFADPTNKISNEQKADITKLVCSLFPDSILVLNGIRRRPSVLPRP